MNKLIEMLRTSALADKAKAMLDGWINSSNSTNEEPDYRKPQQNKPMFGLPGNTPSDIKEQYRQNAWLFGKVR